MEEDIGGAMRRLRGERGWTQEDLAREAKVTQSTVSRLERGYHDPNVVTLRKVATAFGVSIDELLGVTS